jgi:hypothetical protein
MLYYNQMIVKNASILGRQFNKDRYVYIYMPVTVAEWSKSWTVFARSDDGTVGSNPTRGMNVCVSIYSVFVLGSGLAMGWSKESYRNILF